MKSADKLDIEPFILNTPENNSKRNALEIIQKYEFHLSIKKNKVAGEILTDLSKAFDCLNHKLLIAKLNAYGFDNDSLRFICSHLKGRKKRKKVGSYLSLFRA